MKKFYYVLALAGVVLTSCVASFADGTTTTIDMPTFDATGAFTSMRSMISGNLPVIIAGTVAIAACVLIPGLIMKFIKKAAK